MDSYSIETASFMGPMKRPVYKMKNPELLGACAHAQLFSHAV